MLILSTLVFNLLWRFPSRKRSMSQGQRRKEDTGRRTHSCMEKHTLHAILRRCGTGGDWRGLEGTGRDWSCSVPCVYFPSPHQGQVLQSSLRIKLLKQLPPIKADPLQRSTKVIRKQKANMKYPVTKDTVLPLMLQYFLQLEAKQSDNGSSPKTPQTEVPTLNRIGCNASQHT